MRHKFGFEKKIDLTETTVIQIKYYHEQKKLL